jgi:alkylhydroperoxidase/carboxymuconolactone decarboxylase family protein YurZ
VESPYANDFEQLVTLGVPSSRVAPLSGLMNGTTQTNELAPITAELGAMLAHSCRGNLSEARRHGKHALMLGVTRPQVFEALIIGMLHAGFDKFWDFLWMLEASTDASWPESATGDDVTQDEIDSHFGGVTGGEGVPRWVKLLMEYQPELIVPYYRVRADAFREGALARKEKELLLVIMNASEHYEDGLRIHVAAAKQHGASTTEIMEAILTAIPPGGIVGWFSSAAIAAEIAGG